MSATQTNARRASRCTRLVARVFMVSKGPLAYARGCFLITFGLPRCLTCLPGRQLWLSRDLRTAASWPVLRGARDRAASIPDIRGLRDRASGDSVPGAMLPGD